MKQDYYWGKCAVGVVLVFGLIFSAWILGGRPSHPPSESPSQSAHGGHFSNTTLQRKTLPAAAIPGRPPLSRVEKPDCRESGPTGNYHTLKERTRALEARYVGKVQPQIVDIYDKVLQLKKNGASDAEVAGLSISRFCRIRTDGAIQVYVESVAEIEAAALVAAGLQIEIKLESQGLVQGWISAENLHKLSALPSVQRVELPGYAFPAAGSATTQGDADLRANLVRALPAPGPYDGTGVKVGLICPGFAHQADAIASGNLPAGGVILHPTLVRSDDEGTAVAEIIHDLAPGATLYGVSPNTSAEMITAIQWAVAQGCHVLCDDLGFFNQPFFADGAIATASRSAVNSDGRVFVTAAGNDAELHYQGLFTAAPGGNYHDYDATAGTDSGLDVAVANGTSVFAVLQWNDPFGASGNDYDLLVVDTDTGEVIGTSGLNSQDGNDNPLESALWTNTSGVEKIIHIRIAKYAGVAKTLELFVLEGELFDDDRVFTDCIIGNKAVTEVISVGAIDEADVGLDTIEPFSSVGPSTISFPAAATRQTPTICGVDWVSVSGAGGFGSLFPGTSAAAPHIAAICALMLDKSPTATPSQIRNALTSSAADRGTVGFDFIFGHGLADALGAVNSLPAPGLPEIAVEQPVGTSLVDGTASISLGSVNLGSTSSAMTFTVKNTGSANLTGVTVTKDGTNSGDFTLSTSGLAATIAPGGSSTFTVTFTPGATGSRSAAIHIASNDADENPFDIALTGTGETSDLIFADDFDPNYESGLWALFGGTVTANTLGAAAGSGSTGNSLHFDGNGSRFALTQPLDATAGGNVGFSITLANGSVATWESPDAGEDVVLEYAIDGTTFVQMGGPYTNRTWVRIVLPIPLAAQTATTQFRFRQLSHTGSSLDNWAIEEVQIGVAVVAAPEIAVEQPSGTALTDGNGEVPFFSASLSTTISRTFTIRNTGSQNLTGLAISIDGADSAEFGVTTLAASILAPGANAIFTVSHTPVAAGQRHAILHIASNDADESPFDLALLGSVLTVTEYPSAAGLTISTLSPPGNVTPNPSVISVSGLNGFVESVKVKLTGVNHTWPDDLDVFLVAPNGAVCALMSDAGGSADLAGDLTFGDGAPTSVSDNGPIASGFYKPVNYDVGEPTPPGGVSSIGTSLTALVNGDVNGDWLLYVSDDSATDGGSIASWSLIFQSPAAAGTLLPEIVIEHPPGTSLADGAVPMAFATVGIGLGTPEVKTFTVRNIGTGNLASLILTKSGSGSGEFILGPPDTLTLTPGTSTTFSVTFSPTGTAGVTNTVAIQLASNDGDESPFDISLTGQAYSPTADFDSDGMNDWAEVQLSALGFNWQTSNAAMVAAYFAAANSNGLYTAAQIQNLNIGIPVLQRNSTTDEFTLKLHLRKSPDLSNWILLPFTPLGTTVTPDGFIEFRFASPDAAAFYRILSQ